MDKWIHTLHVGKELRPLFTWRIALIAVLLLLSSSVGTDDVYAQGTSKTFSISFKDKDLASILDYISAHTDHKVTYDNTVRSYSGRFTVSFDRVTPVKAIDQLLNKSPFGYTVNGKTITVYPLKNDQKSEYEVKGVVVDTHGETIPNATVQVRAERKGMLTDMDGNFAVKVSNRTGEVTVSCVGFDTQSVKYTAGTPLKIALRESVSTLGEVSVIAYGSKNTREITGAIASVKADKIQDMPTPSIETLLQGQMAGVEVTNISGTPGGGGSQVTIRGYSSLNQQGINDGSPLYVIDGVPVYSTTGKNTGGINTLAGLDPSTIESVEVLKDAASASLYGSRAANGVILITTKKGRSGSATFNASVSQSISWLPETPTQMMGHAERIHHLRLAKAQRRINYDYMTDKHVGPKSYRDSYGWDPMMGGLYDYLWRNGAVLSDDMALPGILQDSLNTFYNNKSNWWDYIFRTGKVTDVDVNATGGTENVRYMVGAGLYDETGIMIGSSFKRASFVTNLDINLSPKVELYTRLALSYTDKAAGSDMGKVQGLTIDPKLSSTLLPGRGTPIEAETLKKLKDIDQKNTNYNIRLNAGIKYNILKGLTLNSSASVNHFMTRVNIFTPDYLTMFKMSRVDASNVGMTMLQTEHLLNYATSFREKHKFDFLAGITYNRDILNSMSVVGENGPTNQIHYIGEGWPKVYTDEYGSVRALQSVLTNFEEQAMLSYLARFSYNYDQKYLLDLSWRTDGSSVFGKNVRWGHFPSIGLGWAFSEERFMKDAWWLSFGKLRASWGRSGQKFQEAYLALGLMAESNSFFGDVGLMPALMANNMLTWEKSDQYDLGVDLQLFNYRVKLSLDYYYKYSHALLMQTPTAGDVYLVDKMWNNASALSNEGIEFAVQWDIFRDKEFNWSTSFNISRNWNLFRQTYDGVDFNQMILGRPLYGIFTYKDDGIIQNETEIPYYYDARGNKTALKLGGDNYLAGVGARKIRDLDMNGKIDTNDLYYAGSTIPLAYGGWSNQFKWKDFYLFIHSNFSIGRKVINMVDKSALGFKSDFGPIIGDYTKHRMWKKEGDKADFPAMRYSGRDYVGQFDGNIDTNIENVSFFRIKQMTLAYSLPKEWFKKIGVKEARIFLTGENLLLLTNYSGLDPEIIDPSTGIDDGSTYPLNRKVTLGLNLKF